MTKKELISAISREADINQNDARAAVEAFINTVTKELKKKDGQVQLIGFGSFTKVRRKARQGRNPQTGEAIKIKAQNVVKFKPSKNLKETVKQAFFFGE